MGLVTWELDNNVDIDVVKIRRTTQGDEGTWDELVYGTSQFQSRNMRKSYGF